MKDFDNNNSRLLEELRGLETELHKDQIRRNRRRMEKLLHPDFVEFGRSGARYTRADILKEFDQRTVLPAIRSEDFAVALLAEGVALLTYLSAHGNAGGNPHQRTLRSSVWVHTETGWQVRFHQGTPISDPQ